MTVKAKLAFKTLSLGLLVLLPFLGHYFLTPGAYRPGDRLPASELIARGNYAQAYRLLLRLNLDDLSPRKRQQVEFQLATCERLLDRPSRAFLRLDRMRDPHPLLEDYRRFWMARSLEEMEEKEGAIAAYEDFLLISRHADLQTLARLHLADLYAELAEFPKALSLYKKLLDTAPKQVPEVLYRMARAYAQNGNQQAAQRRWLQLATDYPQTQNGLKTLENLPKDGSPAEVYARGLVYAAHGNHAQAIREFGRFLRAHPRHQLTEEVHYSQGNSYSANRQYTKALKAFEEVFARYSRPSALFRTGGIQVRRGLETEAIASYEKFVRRFPRHGLADEALWQAAKAAERSDRFDAAENYYRRLAEDYSGSDRRDEAGWNIGFMFYCRKEYKKALVVFQRLTQMAREPHIVDQSLFWAGKTSEQLGRLDRARSYYRRAARGFPRSYYSARAVALGHLDEQSLEPRPSMVLRPEPTANNQIAHGGENLQRADALHQLGLEDLARRELDNAERLNRGDLDALRIVRDRYEIFGMLDRAMRLSTRIFVEDGRRSEIHHLYPNYYWDQIVQAATEAEIDPYLVLSVIRQESSFKEDAVSHAGALGLMQIMPQTGRSLARSLGLRRFQHQALLDPAVSILLGSHFLGDQVRQFAEGPTQELGFELGLAAYNAGPHNARRWVERIPYEDPDTFVERIPFRETRLYVKLVLKNYTIYKALSDV